MFSSLLDYASSLGEIYYVFIKTRIILYVVYLTKEKYSYISFLLHITQAISCLLGIDDHDIKDIFYLFTKTYLLFVKLTLLFWAITWRFFQTMLQDS